MAGSMGSRDGGNVGDGNGRRGVEQIPEDQQDGDRAPAPWTGVGAGWCGPVAGGRRRRWWPSGPRCCRPGRERTCRTGRCRRPAPSGSAPVTGSRPSDAVGCIPADGSEASLLTMACLQLGIPAPPRDGSEIYVPDGSIRLRPSAPLSTATTPIGLQRTAGWSTADLRPVGSRSALRSPRRVCRCRRGVSVSADDRRPLGVGPDRTHGDGHRELPDLEVGEDGRAQRGRGQRARLDGDVHARAVGHRRHRLGEDHRAGDRLVSSRPFEASRRRRPGR